MSVDMAMEGESISMVLDLTGKVNNPGQDVTVELPDTEGYTEVEMPAASNRLKRLKQSDNVINPVRPFIQAVRDFFAPVNR